MAVQLTASLEQAFGRELPGTLVFDYPTLAELSDFLATPPAAETAAAAMAPAAPGLDRQQALEAVLGSVRGLTGTTDVVASTPLMAAGVTSTLAVQLVSALESALGTELPGTLAFDYPTSGEIADFIVAQHREALPAAPAAPAMAVFAGQRDAVVATVVEEVRALGATGDLVASTPLMAAGVTSTLAVQLVSALESALGTELPGTLVFDYPTPGEIADFVVSSGLAPVAGLAPYPTATAGGALAAAPARSCVITAAAHRVPGGKLGFSVRAGNDRVTRAPLERWDVDLAPPDNPLGEAAGAANAVHAP
jgi:acyl carrier protein